MRVRWLAAAWLLSAGTVLAQDVVLTPPTDKYPDSMNAITAYAEQRAWRVDVPSAGSVPEAVRVFVASPFRGSQDIARAVLPTVPQSSIYRFKYIDVAASARRIQPFTFLEVDWNTEGQPRGPNGSFITPHYDFHFYTKDRSVVDRMTCVTTAKVCDSLRTGHAAMRPFMQLPPSQFLPAKYFPDTDSAIAAMGMHSLDGTFDYTVDSVNHNPVIIYGSYDNEVAFLEMSLTLYAFQDAMRLAQTGKHLTWPIVQPPSFAYAWWPTQVELEYLPRTREFSFQLNGFKPHTVTPYAPSARGR